MPSSFRGHNRPARRSPTLPRVRIEDPKSHNGKRTLPLDGELVAALATLRKRQLGRECDRGCGVPVRARRAGLVPGDHDGRFHLRIGATHARRYRAQRDLELTANYPKIVVVYTQIVTMSTYNILDTNEFRDQVGAQWTFLSDAGRHLQKDLDIQDYTDPTHDPMLPYTLMLKPGLASTASITATGSGGRPSFEDLRSDLREVTGGPAPADARPQRERLGR